MANVEIIIRTIDKTAKGTGDAEKRMKAFSAQATKNARSFQALEKQKANALKQAEREKQVALQGTITKFAGYAAAAVAIGVASKKAFDFAEEGAQVLRMEESFDKLGLSLSALRMASGGTVDDMTLMANSAKLVAGVTGELKDRMAEAAPELLRVSRAAVKLDPTIGSVGFVFESLARGIKKNQPLLIDNANIAVKVGDANKKMAASLGKTVEELTAEEKALALLNETLRAGGEIIKQVGGLADDQATSFERARASTTNLTNALKKQGGSLSGLVGLYADVASRGAIYADKLVEINRESDNFITGFSEYGRALTFSAGITRELNSEVDSATRSYMAWTPTVRENESALKDSAETAANLTDRYAGIFSIVSSLQSKTNSFNDSQDSLVEKQNEVLEAIIQAEQQGYSPWSETISNLKKDFDGLNEQMADNAAKQRKNTQELILDRAKQMLSVDELSAEEELYLLDVGQKRGVFTQQVVDDSKRIINEAQRITEGFSIANDALDNLDGKVVTVVIQADYQGFGGLLPAELQRSVGNTPRPGSAPSSSSRVVQERVDTDFIAQEVIRIQGR